MLRLFLPYISEVQNQIVIDGDKAHYLTIVLRCQIGDALIVFDGKGKCFKTEIVEIHKKQVIANIIERVHINTESNANIILLQGILKGEKMDMVVQKATELGVKEIVPIISNRCQIRITNKSERWRKIAEEASRQSGRIVIPTIYEPVSFKNFLEEIESNSVISGLIFWEEDGMPLRDVVSYLKNSSVLLAVGPEGGFAKEEVLLAKEKGLFITSLGKRILRAETAAISAISIIQYAIGDIG